MSRKFLKWLGYGLLGIILLAVIVIAVMIILSEPMPEHPFFENFAEDDFVILAHQGGDGEFPSNTLFAFQSATDLGVDVLELDIHSSADDVLVVIHDDTVDRTTNGSGRVNDMTLAELQALDAGYNFPTLADHPLLNTGEFPYRGEGLQIPSLEEIFIAFPEMPISIEIKQESPSIAQPLCDLIREYERETLTIVPSFSPLAMDEFREACPEVATAGVAPEITTFFALNFVGLGSAWQPITESFMIPEYQGDLHVITQGFVNQAHQHNVVIYPWTINTEEQMLRMMDLGVDGIITDYPSLALALSGR